MKKILLALLLCCGLAHAQNLPSPSYKNLTVTTTFTAPGLVTSADLATSIALTGTPTAPTPAQFDNTTKLATTAFVQRALGNFQGALAFNSNQTLTIGQLGSEIQYFGPSGGIYTLPSAATIPAGSAYHIYNQGPGSLVIQVNGGSDFIYTGASNTSITLQKGDNITLVGRGSTEVDVTGGTASFQAAPLTQIATGQFFANLGARVNNINDRFFIGALTPYNGNSGVQPPDWTGSSYLNGGVPAFGYLEQNGTFDVSAIKGQLPIVAAARASDGTGGGTQATIGVSSVVVNDNVTGAGANTWNFYGTTLRTATATGVSTLGYEQDVENLGSAVPLYPSAMFTTGLTANLWLAVGGELANQTGAGYVFNNTSAAIAILANNGGAYANVAYDKGIIFAANSLNANGIAIAMAPGHQLAWFNTSNQRVGSFTSSATTTATGQQAILGASGFVVDDMSGNVQFQVNNTITSAVDYVQLTAATVGNSPIVGVAGTDTNINLTLQGKGIGTATMPQNDVLTYTNASAQSIPNNAATTITTWTKVFDRVNANFNATTGIYTAPTTGYYHVDAGINYASGTATATNLDYQVAVIANGVTVCVGQSISQQTTSSTIHAANTGCDVNLTVGQTMTIQAFQNSGAANALSTAAGLNYVSIHKLP